MRVVILCGSPRDGAWVDRIAEVLDELEVPVVRRVGSAHRVPEHVLDLLEDDAFSRGETWTCFDERLALDTCASMLARTLRLPVEPCVRPRSKILTTDG